MNNQKKFDLSSNFKNMFKSTDPETKLKGSPIVNINTEKLMPFRNHPFKLYEGERFNDMVESIKANGIITPVIVRSLDNKKSEPSEIDESNKTYEILSGHNRVEAAKFVGLETVPAIVRDDINDDEALLIVTETNLIQRSFSDLSHSEKAAALAVHHEAVKSQGKRTDLINDIENLLKNEENTRSKADFETSGQIVHKLTAREKIASDYGLNYKTVARYLRIYNNLSKDFNEPLDSGQIPFIAAIELSYMSNDNQKVLAEALYDNPELKIDIKKAEFLREFSENNKLTLKIIIDILSGIVIKKRNKTSLPVQPIKIKGTVLSKYFEPEQKPKEIEDEIIKAIEFYRENKK